MSGFWFTIVAAAVITIVFANESSKQQVQRSLAAAGTNAAASAAVAVADFIRRRTLGNSADIKQTKLVAFEPAGERTDENDMIATTRRSLNVAVKEIKTEWKNLEEVFLFINKQARRIADDPENTPDASVWLRILRIAFDHESKLLSADLDRINIGKAKIWAAEDRSNIRHEPVVGDPQQRSVDDIATSFTLTKQSIDDAERAVVKAILGTTDVTICKVNELTYGLLGKLESKLNNRVLSKENRHLLLFELTAAEELPAAIVKQLRDIQKLIAGNVYGGQKGGTRDEIKAAHEAYTKQRDEIAELLAALKAGRRDAPRRYTLEVDAVVQARERDLLRCDAYFAMVTAAKLQDASGKEGACFLV